MPQVKPEMETFAKIKVVGVGGSGGAVVNRMMAGRIRGVEFVVMNTDVQALHHNSAPTKLHIGKSITRGLGAGMDPEVKSVIYSKIPTWFFWLVVSEAVLDLEQVR